MATHTSVLAWRIPGTAEHGGLPSMGSYRVGHYWSDSAAEDFFSHCVLIISISPSSLRMHQPLALLARVPSSLLVLPVDSVSWGAQSVQVQSHLSVQWILCCALENILKKKNWSRIGLEHSISFMCSTLYFCFCIHYSSLEGGSRQNRLHLESRTPSWARLWTLSYMPSIYGNDIPTGKPGPLDGRAQGSYLDFLLPKRVP